MLCPNPACPHALKTKRPAEYRVGVTTCANCGTELVAALVGGSSATAIAQSVAVKPLPRKPFVVLLVVAAAVMAFLTIPLPGIDGELLHGYFATQTQTLLLPPEVTLAVLGVTPWITAYVLVEVGALLIPPLRRRRETLAGRAALNLAADRLGILCAAVQATMIAKWLATINYNGSSILRLDLPAIPVLVASAIAGAVLLRLLASVVDKYGFGTGLALIWVLPAMPTFVRYNMSWPKALADGAMLPLDIVTALAPLGLAIVAVVLLMRLPEEKSALAVPLTGIFPVLVGAELAQRIDVDSDVLHYAVMLVFAVLTAVLFVLLFARDNTIAARWRINDLAIVRSARLAVIPATSGFLVVAFGAQALESHFGALAINTLGFFIIATFVRDVIDEARFAQMHGSTWSVGPLPSSELAFNIAADLRADGIACMVRGGFLRTLLPVFGTWARLSLVVPSQHASTVEERLRKIG